MTNNDQREIKKRFKFENISNGNIVGCYVNDERKIISCFNQDLIQMGNDNGQKALNSFKKILSGKHGNTCYDIEFPTNEVAGGNKHKLLLELRDSKLRNEELLTQLFENIANNLVISGNYIIMLYYDSYDVPQKDKNEEAYDSEEVFRYFVCSICPVKLPKTPLTYSLQNEKFQEFGNGWQVGAPELGFMFPNFTNRGTDIYSVHYYSKKPETIHEELIHALFTEETPMSSVDQKALFHEALKESLGDSCDLDMYLGIQDRLTQIIDNSSEVETEKIAVKKSDIIDILNDCNADEEQIESFENNFDSLFGETEAIPVENLVEQKKMVVEASDIVIHVPADKTSCIEAKIIDNKKYILIRADSGFAINNFDVHI